MQSSYHKKNLTQKGIIELFKKASFRIVYRKSSAKTISYLFCNPLNKHFITITQYGFYYKRIINIFYNRN